MDFSDNKVWLGQDAEPQVSLYLWHGNNFREVLLDKSKIYYLSPYSEDRTTLVLTGGDEVLVDLSMDALNHMLRHPDLRHEKIDLLPYTGPNANQKLTAIFDAVVRGAGQELNGNFMIKAYAHGVCEQPRDSYQLRELYSGDVQYLQEGCDDREYKTYLHGPRVDGKTGCYIDIPCDLMRQFMTHAKVKGASVLDLSRYSDPIAQTPQMKREMKNVPHVYDSDAFLYKPI